MDKRFFNIFGLTEEQALSTLSQPPEQLQDPTDRYVAVAHLINFPSDRSIQALIDVLENQEQELYNIITRRKAVESLGRLRARQALPVIRDCLAEQDCYTVENAVWAIGEIGTEDVTILEEITQLLDKPDQSYRIIIQTLAKLDYQPAVTKIAQFVTSEEQPIASAAISAIYRLTGDASQMEQVVNFLQDSSINARRACIQDLIDAQYYQAIPQISRCPVSLVFRLRSLKMLAISAISDNQLNFAALEPYFDQVIRDHPQTLDLVHEYDQKPTLDFLISELYHTDFGRCYLATQTILELYPTEAPAALLKTWEKEAHNDYGAHYHVIKLLGWLKYAPAYELFIEALQNQAPQFQKSRAAAALALGNLEDKRCLPLLREALNSKIFDLKYACLLALEYCGEPIDDLLLNDPDNLIRAKALILKEKVS